MKWEIVAQAKADDESTFLQTVRLSAPTAADAVVMFRESRHFSDAHQRFWRGKDFEILSVRWLEPRI